MHTTPLIHITRGAWNWRSAQNLYASLYIFGRKTKKDNQNKWERERDRDSGAWRQRESFFSCSQDDRKTSQCFCQGQPTYSPHPLPLPHIHKRMPQSSTHWQWTIASGTMDANRGSLEGLEPLKWPFPNGNLCVEGTDVHGREIGTNEESSQHLVDKTSVINTCGT